jgi:hypothetical protein
MITLTNESLRLDLIDPVPDRDRLGPRYGAGGYVWQVHDPVAGPLLSGPEGPEPHPEPYNGHGLPEAFRHSDRQGQPIGWHEGRALVPGVGVVSRNAQGAITILEAAAWILSPLAGGYRFVSTQALGPRGYQLERGLALVGRVLTSDTRLTNTGHEPMPYEWFAHPFFALDRTGVVETRLPPGVRLDPNPGYTLTDGVLRFQRPFQGKDDGHFELLHLPPGQRLQAELTHASLAWVRFSTSFAPADCPIWGNGFTFSIEPYRRGVLAPGETVTGSLVYQFGPVA